MSKLLLRNGRVLDPTSRRDQIADVLLSDGVVAEIGSNIQTAGAEVFDANGMVVAPGFIDMHVHLREPGFEHAETIETGARAAAAGGFTSVCCMPNTKPVNDSATVTNYILDRARKLAVVNVFPIGAITKGSEGEELAAIGSMKAAGVVAISDDGRPVMNARVMRRAMESARAWDLPLINHCEDLNLSAGGDMHEGVQSTRFGLRGIPSASEDVMVARDILLAEMTGVRYHVAHLSTKHAVAMVKYAKARGLPVSCEVCPHHFSITDSDVKAYDANYKMKPPLRSCCDVDAALEGIADGTVDALATDHAPHPGSEKMQEFEKCPFGILGLETAIGLTFQKLVHTEKISLMKMVELYTTGPAGVLRLNRGTLAIGSPGDVTVLDQRRRWTYDVNHSPSKSSNTPFHGAEFVGGPVATIVNGAIVWRHDRSI
jgi:dihydroorotase